jgi:outer membrane protein assembly factor BamD
VLTPLELAISALAVSALTVAGCEPKKAPPKNALEYAEDAKRAYDKALEAYFNQDWEFAIQQFTEVKRAYGYSRYARLAELRIADCQYRQAKFGDAVSAYKSFVSDYPNDPEVPYARFKIAKALFDDASDSLLLPPLEERDLASIEEARGVIGEYLEDYPSSANARELEYMLEVVTGLLARHELYVARFYLRERRYEAAVGRIDHALQAFAGSGLEAEALVLKGEVLLMMKKAAEARTLFARVLEEYPASPFTVPAKNFLARLEPARGTSTPPAGAAGTAPESQGPESLGPGQALPERSKAH